MSNEDIYAGQLLLRRGAIRGCRSAPRNGLLPLRIVPPLVGRIGQRAYIVEAGGIDQAISDLMAQRARLEQFSRACRQRRKEGRCPILESLERAAASRSDSSQ
jgi:hypothetical protein